MIRPEDEKKINQMVLNLKRSKEIACILLVLFNDELLRQDVEAEIKRRLEPDFNFRELRMTEDMYKNLPVIITREMNPQPNDIFLIYDLKKALPEVLEYLNYRREDFVEHKISVIFWLDEPTLIEIMRKALDFFAFRAMPVIEFMSDRSKDMIIPGRTTPSEIFIYNSLEELNAKIALREEMLRDYLEKRPQDKSTIAGLYGNLGILYYNKSDFNKAMEYYQTAFELDREINDRKGEAAALGNMGVLYRNKGELNKALEYYTQALEIDRRIGDVYGEANQLSNIGVIYQDKGELNKALEYYEQALEINHRIGDV
ncbi:MAG: tetratricopeptide repeat protein, partial [Candidatus Poribacteria bacterium]